MFFNRTISSALGEISKEAKNPLRVFLIIFLVFISNILRLEKTLLSHLPSLSNSNQPIRFSELGILPKSLIMPGVKRSEKEPSLSIVPISW